MLTGLLPRLLTEAKKAVAASQASKIEAYPRTFGRRASGYIASLRVSAHIFILAAMPNGANAKMHHAKQLLPFEVVLRRRILLVVYEDLRLSNKEVVSMSTVMLKAPPRQA